MKARPRQSAKWSSPLTVTLALMLASLMLSGCASPRVVTETKTITVIEERIVPVDPGLTYPQDPPDLQPETWLDALVLGIHYRHRWESCEYRMGEIRGIHGTD